MEPTKSNWEMATSAYWESQAKRLECELKLAQSQLLDARLERDEAIFKLHQKELQR